MPSVNRKVLHVINGEFFSGAERVQDLLAVHLAECGYDASLVCVKPDKFKENCQCDKSKVIERPMHSQLDIGLGFRLAKMVRSDGFRIIHTHTPRTAMLGLVASRLSGVPLIHHLHSPTARCTEDGLRNTINTTVENYVMRRARRVIAVSNSLKQYLTDECGIDDGKITVVLNGVPAVPALRPRPLPVRPVILGAVALFRPRKGLEVLLHALRHLRDRNVSVELRAIGAFESHDYRKSIFELANTLDVGEMIEWVGFVRNIDRELAAMDIFVLPSLFGEGLPMVVLEAMANGVPVIASDVEGVVEAIQKEKTGLIVKPGDAEDLAGKIAYLIRSSDHWETIREQAYQWQRNKLSASAMAEGVAGVYDTVLDA